MIGKNVQRALDVALVGLALALVWQIASWQLGADLLPGPWPTLRKVAQLFAEPRFQRDLMATANAYVIALAIAMAGGLALGVICGGWQSIGEEVEPLVLALIATPKVMLYPIILLFFGLGDAAKIFFGLLPTASGVTAGMRTCSAKLARDSRMVCATLR